jgi:hypothetical protein
MCAVHDDPMDPMDPTYERLHQLVQEHLEGRGYPTGNGRFVRTQITESLTLVIRSAPGWWILEFEGAGSCATFRATYHQLTGVKIEGSSKILEAILLIPWVPLHLQQQEPELVA